MFMARFETFGDDLYIDGMKVIRAYESFSGWYWFATEIVGKQDSVIDGTVYKDDIIYFGLVQGFTEEWGDFSKAEVELLQPQVWEIKKKNLASAGRRKFGLDHS
jgi:hypothetical protein